MTREEFVKKYNGIVERALRFSKIARRYGLLELEENLDLEKVNDRDIFEYGMSFVVDGIDYQLINGILSNIIDQEKDEYMRILKNIQREAVLSIQAGDNHRITFAKLNSLTDINLKDDEMLKLLEE